MNALGEQLRKIVIISYQDILKLKDSIANTYKFHSSKERAFILSRSVHEILDRDLKGISDDNAMTIKKQLLTDTLSGEKQDIRKLDILFSIFTIDIPLNDQRSVASSWLHTNEGLTVSDRELNAFISSYDLAQLPLLEPAVLSMTDEDAIDVTTPITQKNLIILIISLVVALLTLATFSSALFKSNPPPVKPLLLYDELQIISDITLYDHFGRVQQPFPYQEVNFYALSDYLLGERKAIIGESQYLVKIVSRAKLNDIDPLLLLAIIGQEQGFVPYESELKDIIINNPFNVYHSWLDYNTTLDDSTQIAINTLKNRFNDYPNDTNIYAFINHTYAEDDNWSIGVEQLYKQLTLISAQY